MKMALTEEEMNRIAEEFENDTFEHEDGPIYSGSHYQLANSKNQSVTVIYDTRDILAVNSVAERLGCSPVEIYRTAVKQYLQTA